MKIGDELKIHMDYQCVAHEYLIKVNRIDIDGVNADFKLLINGKSNSKNFISSGFFYYSKMTIMEDK